MSNRVDTETLRQWLAAGKPFTVLDIRTEEDRAQWSIPGSVHLNAYADLNEGRPGVLANAALSRSAPVVTVCNMGRVSQIAADILEKRGFEALR